MIASFIRVAVAAGLGLSGLGAASHAEEPGPSMPTFASDEAFRDYMRELRDTLVANGELGGGGVDDMPVPSSAESDGASNETITNNQEDGVDEGGIVKNIGNHLVVLRKGRLYAIDVSRPGEPRQTDSMRVASAEELNRNVWYDEMLVRGNLIYVVGYRYGVDLGEGTGGGWWGAGATEINSYRLEGGRLQRLKTSFFESNDYYSSQNYASRMVDGRLVFYMPFAGFRWHGGEYVPNIPRVLVHRERGRFEATHDLFDGTDVYVPFELPRWPTFHTVVGCDLTADGGIACDARAALGAWGREHYVSSENIYVWTANAVYGFGLASRWGAVHKVSGHPANQLSFKEAGGKLSVLAIDGQVLRLFALPLAAFGAEPSQTLDETNQTDLLKGRGYLWVTANRFVSDDAVVAGVATGGGTILVVHDGAAGATHRHVWAGTVQRIERVGAGRALVVAAHGRDRADLKIDVVGLGERLSVLSSTRLPGLGQGENRSHGFFYKPDGQGGGLFGLAVINRGEGGWHWWGTGVANLLYHRIDGAGALQNLGIISSSGTSTAVCETSCIDWYGNTRPIFLKDRIFNLMGSELVEATVEGNAIAPVGQRATFQ